LPVSKNINSYTDIRQVLDSALAVGGARIRINTKGSARHWMQRAYSFRKLALATESTAVGHIIGYTPSTPYDSMKLSVQPLPNGQADVVIEFRVIEGELLSLDGKTVLEPAVAGAVRIHTGGGEDELLTEAMKIAEES